MQSNPKTVRLKRRLGGVCLAVAILLLLIEFPYGEALANGESVPWFAWGIFFAAIGLFGAATKLGAL